MQVNYVYAVERNQKWEIEDYLGPEHPDLETINRRIANRDNEFAWCNVQIVVTCGLFELGTGWLNFRSYESEEAFESSDDYAFLKNHARERMIIKLRECSDLLKQLTDED